VYPLPVVNQSHRGRHTCELFTVDNCRKASSETAKTFGSEAMTDWTGSSKQRRPQTICECPARIKGSARYVSEDECKLPSRMPFGRHKGTPLDHAPARTGSTLISFNRPAILLKLIVSVAYHSKIFLTASKRSVRIDGAR